MSKRQDREDRREVSDMTSEEQERLVSEYMGEAMEQMRKRLAARLENLDGLNSSFPATREFLAARGLTKVSQLDDKGRQDLRLHLEQKLKKLLDVDCLDR